MPTLSDAIGLELERREKVMSEEVECDVCGFLNDCRNCATQQARIQAAYFSAQAIGRWQSDCP